jgi:hypothetical protein
MAERGAWVEFVDEPLRATVRRNFRITVLILVGGMSLVGFFPPKGGGEPLVATIPWFVVVPGGALVGAGLAALWGLWLRFAYAPFAVDLTTKRLRIRGRTRTFADLTRANVTTPGRDPAELALHLSVTKYLSVTVLVRGADGPALQPERREVLVEVIRGSSITRPSSPYDPTGKFARYNHPYTLDKADAETFVTAPPGPGEPRPWGE